MAAPPTVLLALCLDALFGDPKGFYRVVPHPVALIGRLLGVLDKHMNLEHLLPPRRKVMGVIALMIAVALPVAGAVAISRGLEAWEWGWVPEAIVASMFLAQRSLWDHVAAVASALDSGGLENGRAAVAMIVGRDPRSLDQAGVCRAAIESTAESLCDGVVAPLFWFVLLGLPGLVAYKVINTADSMIGHRTPRHEAFGWAAARLDDLANLIPARIAAMLLTVASIALPGAKASAALSTALRDARKHRSPNAGWPEAAMAGALGLALAGPRRYADYAVDDAWMGDGGRAEATSDDIRDALRLFALTCGLQAFGVLAWTLA